MFHSKDIVANPPFDRAPAVDALGKFDGSAPTRRSSVLRRAQYGGTGWKPCGEPAVPNGMEKGTACEQNAPLRPGGVGVAADVGSGWAEKTRRSARFGGIGGADRGTQ